MNFLQFKRIFEKEPKYRLNQAQRALFQDLIQNWQEAIALPLPLREELEKNCLIGISTEIYISKDKKTIKALVNLDDGLAIETVLMRHSAVAKAMADKKDKRNTVCVSSQVGCAMNCSFCATGKLGFKRNLEIWEILEQVLFFARYLKNFDEKITNIVFMGMGEPFLNYDNVMGAIKILNDKDGFNLGARHISISTAGIIEGIEKLANEGLQVNLAVSLHAPDDELRLKLMPINKKYPIAEILNAVDGYIKKTNRRVMFEYIMINNINDSEDQAKMLARLISRSLYFVNLITYNPTLQQSFPRHSSGQAGQAGIFEPSSNSKIKKFKEILERGGVVVTQRFGFGQDIEGACGQLIIKNLNEGNQGKFL